MLRQQFFTIHM